MSKLVLSKKPYPFVVLSRNEDGFVLVSTMIVMVMLSMVGLASTTSTVMELQISANDRDYKENFYRAEGAAVESAQRLANETDTDELRPSLTDKVWLQSAVDYTIANNWDVGGGIPVNFQTAALDDAESDVRIAANSLGVARGRKASSIEMTKPSVKAFELYGWSEERGGRVIIEVGYKKRF